jgi:CHAT domain-containing protein/Tfp pilus assembly protein PilF
LKKGSLVPAITQASSATQKSLLLLLTLSFYCAPANAVLIDVANDVDPQSSSVLELYPRSAIQTDQEITELELGKSIERELAGGQEHIYRIKLAEGQHARLVVEQRGIDLVVRAQTPTGKLIAEFDSEIRLQGPEQIELVADADGSYRLSIQAKQQEAPTGGYAIRFVGLRASTEKDRSLQKARMLYAESLVLRRAGKYDEALARGNSARETQEGLLGLNHADVATSINNLAVIHYLKSDYITSEQLHRRALEIRTKVLGPDHPHVAYSLNNLAILLDLKGEYTKATLFYKRSLEIKEKTQGLDHPDVATTLNNLGGLHLFKGEFVLAEQLYQRGLEIKEKASGPNHPSVASSLNNLGLVYRNMGDYDKAGQIHERALEIREKALGPDHPDVATSLNNLAALHVYKGNLAKAEQLFQRALEIRIKALGPEHRLVATSLNNLAELYYKNGDYANAEVMNRRAMETRIKLLGPNHPEVASSLYNLGTILQRTGNFGEAERLYQRALEIREEAQGQDHPSITDVLNNLARLYAAKGDLEQAIKTQLRANTITDRNITINLISGSERQKLAYMRSLSDITSRSVSLHVRAAPDNREARALAATSILQRKGRVLDVMSESLTVLRKRLNEQDQLLLDELTDATAHLAKLVLNEPQRISRTEHQKQIKAVEEVREKLEGEISRRSAGYYRKAEPITLAAVGAVVPGDAALIEFASYHPFDPKAPDDIKAYNEPHYVAYVIGSGGEARATDLGTVAAIDVMIDAWRQALRDPKRNDVKQLARMADEKIMQPVRALVGNATRLLVSPDGALNLIPFEALVDEQGRFLVERYAFTYLTSGRDLLRMQVTSNTKGRPLVVANPLFGEARIEQLASAGRKPAPRYRRQSVTAARELGEVYFAPLGGTAQEARTIQALFPEAQLLTGTRATESALKEAAAPSIFHIATHGFFLSEPGAIGTDLIAQMTIRRTGANTPSSAGTAGNGSVLMAATRGLSANAKIENPLLRSGLALAGANVHTNARDDGILTALEASGLNLWGTKLVVLSACDTGLGEVRNGEGVYGLRRAFVLAGAESLVMSLWPVSDYSTRNLMINYYKNLKLGMGRGAALRQVQLDLLKRDRQLHPFYWANFIQSGEWANLDGKR